MCKSEGGLSALSSVIQRHMKAKTKTHTHLIETRHPSWRDGHITNHLSYHTMFSVTPLEENSHTSVPWVGGFASKSAHCCFLAGRKQVDGDKPEAMMLHSSSPHGYMFRKPSVKCFSKCPWSLAQCSHHYSHQLGSSQVNHSVSSLFVFV